MIRVDPSAQAGGVAGTAQQGGRAAEAASGFEQLLLRELAQSLVAAAVPEGSAGGAAGSMLSQLLPDALTQALVDAGGLGLAAELAPGLEETGS